MPQNMSAAAKKKAKKKAKDKEKKAKEKEAGAAKGPKVTAAVRRMQEAQEARLKAEAEAKAAEDERVRRVRPPLDPPPSVLGTSAAVSIATS